MAVTVRCGWDATDALPARARDGSPGVNPGDHTTASADCQQLGDAGQVGCAVGVRNDALLRAREEAEQGPVVARRIAAPEADQRRSGSPSGSSTLTTSAPPSASSRVQ